MVVFAHHVGGKVHCVPLEDQIRVCGGVFGLKHVAGLAEGCQQGLLVGFGKHDRGARFPWDGVSESPAVDFCHAQVDMIQRFKQRAVHEFVGVRQSFVDVHAAVAPRGAAQHHTQRGIAVLDRFLRGVAAP